MKKRIVGLLAAALTFGGTITGAMVVTSTTATAGPCGHWSEGWSYWEVHYYKHCGANRAWVNYSVNNSPQPSICLDPGEEYRLGKYVTNAHSNGARC